VSEVGGPGSAGRQKPARRERRARAGALNPRDAFGSHDDADHVYNTPRAWYMLRYLNPRTWVWEGADADYTPTTAQLDALTARVKALEDARDVIEDNIDDLTRDLDETNHDLALNYVTKGSASSTYLTKTAAASTYLPLTGGTLTGDLTIRKAYPQIVLQQTGGKGVRISTGSGGESFILNTLAGGHVPLTVYTVNFQDQAWLEYSTTAGRFTFTKPVKATIVS